MDATRDHHARQYKQALKHKYHIFSGKKDNMTIEQRLLNKRKSGSREGKLRKVMGVNDNQNVYACIQISE